MNTRKQTSHLVTTNVVNHAGQWRDKRGNPAWYDSDVLAGTRLVLKTFSYEDRIVTEIGKESVRLDAPTDPHSFFCIATSDINGVVKFNAERNVEYCLTSEDLSDRKNLPRYQSRLEFEKAIWAALGPPIDDYTSVFQDCEDFSYRNANEALYHLYKKGAITLSDIRSTLIDVQKQSDEDYKKEKEMNSKLPITGCDP